LCDIRIEKTNSMWFTCLNTSSSEHMSASLLNCLVSTCMTCWSVAIFVASVRHLSARWHIPFYSALMHSFDCVSFTVIWSRRTFCWSIPAAAALKWVFDMPWLFNWIEGSWKILHGYSKYATLMAVSLKILIKQSASDAVTSELGDRQSSHPVKNPASILWQVFRGVARCCLPRFQGQLQHLKYQNRI